MRLAANLALFACGWWHIWRYLHAANMGMPVLLHCALHQQQRPGEQRETDEVRSSLKWHKTSREKNTGCLNAVGGRVSDPDPHGSALV